LGILIISVFLASFHVFLVGFQWITFILCILPFYLQVNILTSFNFSSSIQRFLYSSYFF
jgi:hypothetical protein